MKATKPSDTTIVLTRTFAAPRETVFAALTRPEHLRQWMHTTERALVACEVDLCVGGALRYVYQRSNGGKLEVRGVYQTVDPPRGFVYEESYDFSPLRLLASTVLEEKGGKTVLRQTLGYGSRQGRDEDFDGVASSAAEAFDRLEGYLAEVRE